MEVIRYTNRRITHRNLGEAISEWEEKNRGISAAGPRGNYLSEDLQIWVIPRLGNRWRGESRTNRQMGLQSAFVIYYESLKQLLRLRWQRRSRPDGNTVGVRDSVNEERSKSICS